MIRGIQFRRWKEALMGVRCGMAVTEYGIAFAGLLALFAIGFGTEGPENSRINGGFMLAIGLLVSLGGFWIAFGNRLSPCHQPGIHREARTGFLGLTPPLGASTPISSRQRVGYLLSLPWSFWVCSGWSRKHALVKTDRSAYFSGNDGHDGSGWVEPALRWRVARGSATWSPHFPCCSWAEKLACPFPQSFVLTGAFTLVLLSLAVNHSIALLWPHLNVDPIAWPWGDVVVPLLRADCLSGVVYGLDSAVGYVARLLPLRCSERYPARSHLPWPLVAGGVFSVALLFSMPSSNDPMVDRNLQYIQRMHSCGETPPKNSFVIHALPPSGLESQP